MDWTVVAAGLSAIAALAAAVATWRSPLSAARLAEELRKSSEKASEQRRLQMSLFQTLMQERGEIYSAESVRALNSIDIAYHDRREVREAWAEVYQALNQNPLPPDHVVDERIRKLLKSMAEVLGLADSLRLDDFGRVYTPTALAEERQIKFARRQEEMQRLLQKPREQSEQDFAERFPPPPQD